MNALSLDGKEVASGAAWARGIVSATPTTRRSPASVQHRSASLQPASYDADAKTIDVTFTTGAAVVRSTYLDGTFREVLSTGSNNVRLDRLNAGAPLLDSHNSGALGNVLGAVVPGSARMVGGQGVAKVRLSDAARAADTVADIRDGVIRNVSVGYLIHSAVQTDGEPMPTLTVTDWEPIEISAVAVPADAGAQFRALPSISPKPSSPMSSTDTATTSRSAIAEGTEHFRRVVDAAGAAPQAPTQLQTMVRGWAEAIQASGTPDAKKAGQALAARHGVTLEGRR